MKYPSTKNIEIPRWLDISPHLYFDPVFGVLYRLKLESLVRMLDDVKYSSIMEIGFGSGIALKELACRAERVLALDIHNYFENVRQMLKSEKITGVELIQYNIFEQPLVLNHLVDCIVSSSVFEHVKPSMLRVGIQHISDCLNSSGILVVGFPLKNALMDGLFKMYEFSVRHLFRRAYNFSLENDHPSGQREIIPYIQERFTIEKEQYCLHKSVPLYLILKCRKKKSESDFIGK